MSVTASMVKELRERTGLGMMECKKALVASEGNIEKAIENLRKSGQAKAAKKAGRVAAEGCLGIRVEQGYGVIVEVNSETDFVAMEENFKSFVQTVADTAFNSQQTDVTSLLTQPSQADQSLTLEQVRQALVLKLGENLQIRRAKSLTGNTVGSYLHNNKIGVLVALSGGDENLAKDIAMHIAAANPMVCEPNEIAPDVLAKEKEIFIAQAKDSGKADEIIEKMVEGRLRKYKSEISLVEQPFVKNPDQKIGALLKAAKASVTGFTRFEVGEGIEKEEKNFAEEVMEQVKG